MADVRWGQHCRAYNLHIRPDRLTRQRLVAVQDAIQRQEQGLLRVPEHALHISLAWLLPVHEEFARPKDDLWQQHGPAWWARTRQILTGFQPCRVGYRQLVSTATAIIALVQPTDALNAIRARLAAALDVDWDLCRGELVHTTLFRHESPARPADPAPLDIELAVEEICLVREDVFPSLQVEILDRCRLGISRR